MRLDNDALTNTLSALRQETAAEQAPPRVEENLLAAFRAQQKVQPLRPPARKFGWMPWLAAAAAAIAIAAFVFRPQPQPAVQIVRTPARMVVPTVEKRQEAPVRVVATARSVRRTLKRPVVATPKPTEQPLEAWSDFVEVPYAPPLNA